MKKINFISGVAVVALMLGISFTSCSSSNNAPKGPTKTDPSTIATADLVAYFPFNGNGKDSITGLTPKAMPGVTYVTAKRGKGFQGANNAYFLYDLPAASKLKALKAFTVAMWINEPQSINPVPPVPMIFEVSNDSDLVWGNLSLTQDRMGTAAAPVDSLALKAFFRKDGVPFGMQFVGFPNPALKASTWLHLIYNYDNVTSTFNVYVNGVKLNLPASWTNRYTDNTSTTKLGDLNFVHASQLVFGGWLPTIEKGDTADTWQGWFNGILDEFRLYDRALTATESKALYDAEVTQLNP